jgi:hypothetical protein
MTWRSLGWVAAICFFTAAGQPGFCVPQDEADAAVYVDGKKIGEARFPCLGYWR